MTLIDTLKELVTEEGSIFMPAQWPMKRNV